MPLLGEASMLLDTIGRVKELAAHPFTVVCNEAHRFIVAEQLREAGIQNHILLEPSARNTAPAIAVAALHGMTIADDPVLLVLAADHAIKEPHAFRQAIEAAYPFAANGKLVTFGIVPQTPETGYGYLRAGESLGGGVSRVDAFIEKPDLDTAKQYLSSGKYLWNSGLFMFKASRYLEELKLYRPDILAACEKAFSTRLHDLDFIRVGSAAFEKSPSESVDYAVMEKTHDAVVVPMDAGWSDVGSWSTLWEVHEKDQQGNVLEGDILALETTDCYIKSSNRLVTTIGLDKLVIVETKDAILVAAHDKVQDVKTLVSHLKSMHRPEVELHREVYRPWGKYDAIDTGERFHVKRITVKPGAKLSLQLHHHRAEHWVVVSGTAKMTLNGVARFITENESVYIPIAAVHSLENPGRVDLVLIEVQSGSYLGEDDIVRLGEHYYKDEGEPC
jgi:mannose-1-phosphate guanylyltransferase